MAKFPSRCARKAIAMARHSTAVAERSARVWPATRQARAALAAALTTNLRCDGESAASRRRLAPFDDDLRVGLRLRFGFAL